MERQNEREIIDDKPSSFRIKLTKLLALAPLLIACDKGVEEVPKAETTPPATLAAEQNRKTPSETNIQRKIDERKLPPKKAVRTMTSPDIDSTKIGPTVFLGDSLTFKLGELGGKLDIAISKVIAKGNMNSSWTLARAEELGRNGELKNFENAVMLVGTNDLGSFTVETSFRNIENTYRVLSGDLDYDGTKDVEGVDHIYGVTIPPFQGKNAYSSEKNFDTFNARREEINRLIRSSRLVYQVIDLAKKRKNGGFADDENPNALTSIGPNNWEYDVSEGIHFPKSWLRMVYERELKKGTRRANEQR